MGYPDRTRVAALAVVTSLVLVGCVCGEETYTRDFAVHITGGRNIADQLADKYGYINNGQIGTLDDHYLFSHPSVSKRSAEASTGAHKDIANEPEVEWLEQQVSRTRVKRSGRSHGGIRGSNRGNTARLHYFSDPLWTRQWYLDGNSTYATDSHASMNIQKAWALGYTGRGVVVSIMDDGLEYTHQDIANNYDADASYDYVSRDPDPMPRYVSRSEENMHGTRCAGEVVMQPNNSFCGVGIAYNAHIGGIRMLDGGVTDEMEASSLNTNPQHIDILSASWGPDDRGYTVEGPAHLAKKALEQGVLEGRGGKGSIFVWASGNGGIDDDDCNTDGYANSIYTLVVSSTTEHQSRPFYSEHCTANLATTFSSGSRNEKKVLSTDLHNGCVQDFTGTSASAPIAAGICALALEANGNLTWRDMQYLVVITSKRHQLVGDWTTNGAGYQVSHWFGFGLMDAAAMVERATTWESLPRQLTCSRFAETTQHLFGFFTNPRLYVTNLEVANCKEPSGETINFLEHVQLTVSVLSQRRGNIVVRLTSPSGTQSTLLSKRREDRNRRGFNRWTLMTVHFWGENPTGNWTLQIGDGSDKRLTVKMARLTLRGTSTLPRSLRQRSESISSDNVLVEDIQDRDLLPEAETTHDLDQVAGEADPSQRIVPVWPLTPITRETGLQQEEQRERRAAESSSLESWDSSWWWSSSDYIPYDTCHDECLYGCDGPSANDCYKCRHYKDRITMDCVGTCPVGQFAPPELHVRCGRCSSHCKTCSGPSKTDCLTCPNNKYLNDHNQCVTSCGHGYYQDQFFMLCRQCAPLCTACRGNENTCTACIPGAVLRASQCITRCMASEYLEGNTCRPCHSSCYSCSGPTEHHCTACYDDYVHKDKTCVRPNECSQGYYISHSYDASARQCLRCHSTCQACQGPSFTDCTSCNQNSFLVGGACMQTCENGKYLDKTGACKLCSEGCIICSDADQCIQCEARRVLFKEGSEVSCREGCPDGQYSAEGECFPCHSSCETCNAGGIMDCTTCKQTGESSKYLLEGACVGYCPYGYFGNYREHTCEECDESCRTCTGFNPDQCVTCVAGLNLDEGRCIEDTECEATNCDVCVPGNPSACQSCLRSFYLHGTECLNECPAGRIATPVSRSCELCHPSCATCNGTSDNCNSCDERYFLLAMDGLCLTECPANTYAGTHKVCKDCDEHCWTCTGAGSDSCTSCYEVTEFLSGSSCVEQCPDGEYGDEYTGTCRSCHPSCATCGGPGDHECNTCHDDFTVDDGFCRSDCSGKSFADSSGTCQPCHDTCQSCTGPSARNCLSCNYYNFLHDKECLVDCPIHFYPDYESNVCHRCHDSCKTCLDAGPQDCIECSEDTYMLLRNGQTCVEVCPEGFYESDDLQFKDCRQCSIECRDCHSSYLTCISCHDGTYLYQERCFSTCPSGYDEDPATNHCIQRDRLCPMFCTECDKWGDCIRCEENYVEYFGECVWQKNMACNTTQYIASFYDNGSANCQPCDESCATCLGPEEDDCVSCKATYHFSGSRCVKNCGEAMYEENSKCYDCHPTCATCHFGSASDCTSCPPGMRLSGTSLGTCGAGCREGTYPIYNDEGLLSGCQSCHDSSCTSCVGPEQSDCLTCQLGYFRKDDGACSRTCPVKTYEYMGEDGQGGNECRNCHISCASCIGASAAECTSCPDVMVFVNGQCVWECDVGYYKDSLSTCERCSETCQTCKGPQAKNCTSCKAGQVLQDHVCVDSCEDGYFLLSTDVPSCAPCDPSCLSCMDYGPFDCTECPPSFELEDGVCYNRCGVGNYFDSKEDVRTCKKCSPMCNECFGPGDDQCVDCYGELRLERIDKNHTQCIPCCSDAQPDQDCCDLCEEDNYKCSKAYINHSKPSGVKADHVATIVFAVLVVIILFFVVFGLLQARSHGRLCWSHRYSQVPAYGFNTKDSSKYVTLGKPSDDYYEEDIYGEVSDDDEDDIMEEPDTFQTSYRTQDFSHDKNGVIDHL